MVVRPSLTEAVLLLALLASTTAGFSLRSVPSSSRSALFNRYSHRRRSDIVAARATATPEGPDDSDSDRDRDSSKGRAPDTSSSSANRDLYASLRARLEAAAPRDRNKESAAGEDDDADIPFFADEERAEKAQRIEQELQQFDAEQTSKVRGAEYLAWDRQRDSVGIARATVQSLVLLSFSAFAVSGLSYSVLGSKLVHERGDLRAVQYQAPSTPRYTDPDALLREEEPEGTDYSRTDQLLYNQLFDGSTYRSVTSPVASDESKPI